jgi:hypothetical protein
MFYLSKIRALSLTLLSITFSELALLSSLALQIEDDSGLLPSEQTSLLEQNLLAEMSDSDTYIVSPKLQTN